MISEQDKNKVFQVVNIVEVIEEHITLTKKGANYEANCPFHDEKTPSFSVSPQKEIFKCFGCGKSGDAIQFLKEFKNWTFPETIEFLAKKYNISIKKDSIQKDNNEEILKKESFFLINEFSQKHFQAELLASKNALDYSCYAVFEKRK